MTAQAYNALDGDSLGADKIIRATTMQSLYDNPTAIAQRGSGAPWNNGIGAIAVLTSGSGNWTVPDGVYRIKVTAVGGGGGGLGTGGSPTAGGNTTFSTLTANGGGVGASTYGGAGGTASGGDLNFTGQRGGQFNTSTDEYYQGGGDSMFGQGGRPGAAGTGYGAGGGAAVVAAGSDVRGGGGGGTAIKVFTTTPGGTLAYSVGAAGAGGTGSGAGTAGIIIIEY